MKKYIVGVILSIGILVSPTFTHAAGLTQAQINAIIGLLQSFGADQSTINNVQAALTGTSTGGGTQLSGSTGDSSGCIYLTQALIIGSTDATTNGEVSKLQQFLVVAGVYPEARITGYYGSLTAQAVVRWQKAHGMDFVTTTSGVGPMTRAKLQAACSNQPSTLESQIQSAVNQALAGSGIGGYQPIPKGTKLLSTKVAINDNVVTITLNFNKAILADGEATFEDTFSLVSNTIHPIVVGEGKDPKYAGLNYFTLIEGQPLNEILPITCVDQSEAKAVITSLSSYSGPVGIKLEIKGCNFAGFEDDKNAIIENSQGVPGILYGELGSTAKVIKVTLKSPLCQKVTSYSGLPCDAWLTLTPGVYKIYTTPWGANTKSNEATFTIK